MPHKTGETMQKPLAIAITIVGFTRQGNWRSREIARRKREPVNPGAAQVSTLERFANIKCAFVDRPRTFQCPFRFLPQHATRSTDGFTAETFT